jgi:hypothetical protein
MGLKTTAAAVLCAAALAGCSSSEPTKAAPATKAPSGPATVTLKGELRLMDAAGVKQMNNNYDWCLGKGDYEDLYYGTQVTVTDAAGTKVALGGLDEGRPPQNKEQCWFKFTVLDVPDTPGVFTLTIGERGGEQDFTIAQYKKDPTMFTLLLGEDVPSVDDPWTTEDGLTQAEADCLNSKPDDWESYEECTK